MGKTVSRLVCGGICAATLQVSCMFGETPLAPATIVVYNQADPNSAALAKFYSQQRAIPRDHLVALDCSSEEDISRDEFETTIAEPLRRAFRDRHWWSFRQDVEGKEIVAGSSIHYVALIKGVPLKIRPSAQTLPGEEGLTGPIGGHNEASVDSELSTLGFGLHHIAGAVPNPYFQSFRGIGDFESATLLLVCRLDASEPAIVRRMITDAIAAEKTGLWGRAYVDGSHRSAPGSEVGDKWMSDIVEQCHRVGIPVVFEDSPAIFPEGYPMTECALYYGWYAGNVAGPFDQLDFRFVPGAIAVHIHSFSASTLRDPNAGWVAPLLARGAAATTGNVYEPYLQLTAHLDVLNDRLLHGFTFAESAYMSVQALSWMSVMVGDPLYRPYGSWLQLDGRELAKGAREWKAYHDFATKNVSRPPAEYRALARQTASRARNGPMLEDLGLMEAASGNFGTATGFFQQARANYTKRDDILRAVLELADALVKDKKPNRAIDLVRSVLAVVPDAPASQLLRKIESQATGSPTPGRP